MKLDELRKGILKINSIHFGGKWLIIGLSIGLIVPASLLQ